MEGPSLAQRLSALPFLSAEETTQIAVDVLRGLEHAHARGIVHRDLKPSNVLLDANGTAKLADFGIARHVDETTQLTETGVVVGTAMYLSPEQGAGQAATPQSDLYSLGCVLYRCLTGHPPFAGETAASLLYQHLHVLPQPITAVRADVPWALLQVIDRSMAKSPADRFPSAHAMSAALTTAVGAPARTQPIAPVRPGAAVTGRLSTASQPTTERRGSRWRRWAFVGTVVLVVAAFVGILGTALLDKHPPPVEGHDARHGATGASRTAHRKTGGSGIAPALSPTTTSTSAPATTSATLPVVACPTQLAVEDPTTTTAPATMSATLPSSVPASQLSFYAASTDNLTIMAPSGWSCQATVAVDGGGSITVLPPSESGGLSAEQLSATGDPQAVTATTTGGCQGCAYGVACPFFTASALGPLADEGNGLTCRGVPSGEDASMVSSTEAVFFDPAGVAGTGDPSGGPYPANGVVILQGPTSGAESDTFTATCTLPEQDHALCTAILNDFSSRNQ